MVSDSTTQQTRATGQGSTSANHRVVITGMGAITPVGNSVAETWDNLIHGRSGATIITVMDVSAYPNQVGAELHGFDPLRYIPRKKARLMPLGGQVAVAAAIQAVDDAGLDFAQEDTDRVGVILGTAGGNSFEEVERATQQMLTDTSNRITPYQFLRALPNVASFFVSEFYQLKGYTSTVCTACAAGTQAIGEAAKVIQRGEVEVILAGGTESLISEVALASFTAMRALSTRYNDAPERAMRPFDADRDGFIPAQGCAVLVLESLDHARTRGARIYAEVLGSGVSCDAFHLIAPDPEGKGATLAMRRALQDAGLGVGAIDYINAHAASTPLGDLAETKAIKMVFGERAYDIPISSTKSMIGHTLGAAGAIEAVACVKTIQEGIIHPTINYETFDPDCDLDCVPNVARQAVVNIALSNSFGIGGQNACLILGKYER